METGEPYIVNIDTCNEALPEEQKKLGLEIKQSNLCSEITLPTNEERTAVCCLSSVNLEHFDAWSVNDTFISDLVTMLDNVLEHFINSVKDKGGYSKAAYSAMRERSIGLGAMGFHSYLQASNIPFESALAVSKNQMIFKHIKDEAVAATEALAKIRGEYKLGKGTGRRNSHLLAIAPNANLEFVLEEHRLRLAKGKEWLEEEWRDIIRHEGSVQHLDYLSDWEKDVFKTAFELDQHWVVQHAADRQVHICQGQSVNVFFEAGSMKSSRAASNTDG
jgi:ribonucleoside-diphosphate reductase alpha chain